MLSDFQQLINAWEIPFYAGWSIMDLFRLVALLIAVSMILNYFYGTAGSTK
jgi:hypothetical protein